MDLTAVEILQVITIGFVGFVWVEIRELRKSVADARERLNGLETLEEARQR